MSLCVCNTCVCVIESLRKCVCEQGESESKCVNRERKREPSSGRENASVVTIR